MRVIAGSARSLKLVTPEGLDTRPTSDRIKETLFNICQPELPDSIVLDLFAGSGGLGIEAASRGARHVYFVENNPAACKCIQENIRFTHFDDRSTLLRMDVLSALGSIREKAADIIFMDPPYNKGLEMQVLKQFEQAPFVTERTLIVLESPLDFSAADLESEVFEIVRNKRYKTNQHFFIKKH